MEEIEFAMPLLGGVFIGIASAIMLLFNGRIAGISGIFSGMLFKQGTERKWRTAFVIGLIVGGVGLKYLNP